MSDQNRDYATIRQNVEAGITRQKWAYRLIFFGFHVVFYLVTMAVVWGTLVANAPLRDRLFNGESGGSLIVILPTIMWTLLLLCHGAALYVETDAAEKNIRQQLLLREVGEDILRRGLMDENLSEKPKRNGVGAERMRLSDDGELIPGDEDEAVEDVRPSVRDRGGE